MDKEIENWLDKEVEKCNEKIFAYYSLVTKCINTIPPEERKKFMGDTEIEKNMFVNRRDFLYKIRNLFD